jgi:hypothetical protein
VVAFHYYEICNICGKTKCEHHEGNQYDGVRSFSILTQIDLDHISLVENPANPLCVIESYSLSKSELKEILQKEDIERFVYGETPLYCHHCEICDGS